MNVLMSEHKKYYTKTRDRAERIVLEAMKTYGDEAVKKNMITKKKKVTKEEIIEYYIVEVTIEHYEVRDLVFS